MIHPEIQVTESVTDRYVLTLGRLRNPIDIHQMYWAVIFKSECSMHIRFQKPLNTLALNHRYVDKFQRVSTNR